MSININTVNDINTLSGDRDALIKLNDGIKTVYTSLTNLKGVQDNALGRQNDVKYLVESEANRLNDKKETVDKAIDTQNRIIYFNDNSRKIYTAYLKILIAIVIILAIIFLLRVLAKQFESIPIWIINIIIIIIVSTGLIFVYNYYIEIRRRSRYNFDELELAPPPSKDVNKKAVSGLSLLDDSKTCQGADCCIPAIIGTPGSQWNELLGKCEYQNALLENVSLTPDITPSATMSSVTLASTLINNKKELFSNYISDCKMSNIRIAQVVEDQSNRSSRDSTPFISTTTMPTKSGTTECGILNENWCKTGASPNISFEFSNYSMYK